MTHSKFYYLNTINTLLHNFYVVYTLIYNPLAWNFYVSLNAVFQENDYEELSKARYEILFVLLYYTNHG